MNLRGEIYVNIISFLIILPPPFLSRSWKNAGGFIATNPNCSTIAMTVGLKPLLDAFGLQHVMATTLQGISGSGYPGLPMMDM